MQNKLPTFPPAPVYLFYGNQVEPIFAARDGVLAQLYPGEEDAEARNENVTEYSPPSNRFGVELSKTMGEIAGDLGMVSFIAGAPKVAIVHNPMELFGGRTSAPRGGKKKAAAAPAEGKDAGYLDWLEHTLPETGNRIILLAMEDEAEGREVEERSPGPLFSLIARIGHTQRFRDGKAAYRLEDAVLARDATATLAAIEDLWSEKGKMIVYTTLVRGLRFMMQANIARDRKLEADAAQQAMLFPERGMFSLFKAPDFVRRKHLSRAGTYRTPSLLKAYEGLMTAYRALRPRPGELFVPDARPLIERTLIELISSPRGR